MSNPEQGGEPLEPRLHRFEMTFDSGVRLDCNPTNTMLFLHSEEPLGDHIFVFNTDEDDNPDGNPVFRAQLTNFDEVVAMMRRNGYQIIEGDYLTDGDRKMYNMFLAANPNHIPKLPESPLTERQERLAWFVAYLLHKEYLTVEDFENGTGDLFI
jgi:hypothetical protein